MVLKSSVKKQTVFAVIILLFIIFIFLICAEIYLRATEAYIVKQSRKTLGDYFLTTPELAFERTSRGKRLRPDAHIIVKNHQVSHADVYVDINSRGFRDEELPVEKGDKEIRILVLGDSITLGSYLPAEKVYGELVEKNLQSEMPNYKIEVVNAGMGDIGLKEELDILEEKGLDIKPDIVLLAFYLNDSCPPWNTPFEFGHRGFLRSHLLIAEFFAREVLYRSKKEEILEPIIKYSEAGRKLDWKNNREDFLKFAKMADFDWGSAWEDRSWEIFDNELTRLKKDSEENHFKVAVVVFPVYFQVYSQFVEDKPQRNMEQRSTELGFYYLDLLPTLRDNSQINLFFDHCHPNQRGNEIIGDEISRFLFKEVFPDLHL